MKSVKNIQAVLILLGVFGVACLSVIVLPVDLSAQYWGNAQGGVRGGASGSFRASYQSATQCDGTLIYVDAQGERHVAYEHPEAPVQDTGAH